MSSRTVVVFVMAIISISCGGDNSTNDATPASGQSSQQSTIPDYISNAPPANIEILLIGNSHSSVSNFPNLIKILIEANSNQTVNSFSTDDWDYLSDRSRTSGSTYDLVHSRAWTHIVLQAQKYSTSGSNSYSTTAAEEWVALVKKRNAIPIMYPEHPRYNNPEEGLRVYNLHNAIARAAHACVAPIGPAWDKTVEWYPDLSLHLDDGNHFNELGAFLSALVFYQVITDQPADKLPFIDKLAIDEATQTQVKQVVADTMTIYPPCENL